MVWWFVLIAYAGTRCVADLLGAIVRRDAHPTHAPRTLLITGRFFSGNWSRSHLLPLAGCAGLQRVLAVVDGPVTGLPAKVELRRPATWLQGLLGRNLARAVTTLWLAMRLKPDLVMGYHLFPAGMTALLAARASGARAIYQSTGGPTEIVGGGHATENAVLSRLNGPSRTLERLALALCAAFDAIVVRGRLAQQYFADRGAGHGLAIIPGSIEAERLDAGSAARLIDVVFVGRLTEVKQPDQVIEIATALRRERPDVRVVLAGEGPMRETLAKLALQRGVAANVELPGHIERVEDLLMQSRVFVLTSRSEGLSIAMAEAMAAGCVPVVADVGDLAELVENGVTGWRVPPNDITGYADRVRRLLTDEPLWRQLSAEAQRRARDNNGLEAVSARWDALFERLSPRAPLREVLPA